MIIFFIYISERMNLEDGILWLNFALFYWFKLVIEKSISIVRFMFQSYILRL